MRGGGGLFFYIGTAAYHFSGCVRATDPILASKGMEELIFLRYFIVFFSTKAPLLQ
jgi:hypothetical protein